jgi:acyl-CoA thioesterase
MGYLQEIEKRGSDANPFFRMMGIRIVSYAEGEAVLAMEVRPEMYNGVGWMQGGLFAALCDEAMALALYTKLEDDEGIATISETTTFLRGAKTGTIMAEGKVIRKGRRVAFTEGYVRQEDEAGTLLSRTSASFAIVRD